MLRACHYVLRRRAAFGIVSRYRASTHSERWSSSTTTDWKGIFEGNVTLQENSTTGLFGVPELETASGFSILTEQCIKDCKAILQLIPTLRGAELVDAFDRLSNSICKTADLAAYVQHSHPDSLFRQEANAASLRLLHLTEELNVNQALHSHLANLIQAKDEFSALPEQAQRTAQLLMNDFEISGVHLDEDGRKQCVSLDQHIQLLKLHILSSFGEPVVMKPRVLPEVLAEFSQVPYTPDGNCIVTFQADHYHPKVRQRSFTVFNQHHPQRAKLLTDLLKSRHALATAIGYSSYAERALRFSSAASVDRVVEFLDKLSEKLRPFAEKEVEVLKEIRNRCDAERTYVLPNSAKPDRPIEFSDIHYMERKLPAYVKSSVTWGEESLNFTVGSVMEGLDKLLQRTFGLRMHPVAPGKGEVWHDSVVKLAVEQLDSQADKWTFVGHLFCDFFNRPDKESGDCHYTIRCGFNRPCHPPQTPQSALSITSQRNFPLSIATVRTFFHEFGHGLHSMLGQPQFQHAAGTRCSNDFAEVPSELMEFFCEHEEVLALIADNKDADASKRLAAKLQAEQHLFQALQLQEQLAVARYDLEVHRRDPPCSEWIEGWYHEAQRRHTTVPVTMESSPHLRVSHIASYGATYYSYPWALATAALLWKELFAADPFSLEAGSRYRDALLRNGNAVAPSQMLANLLGRTPDVSDLVGALSGEVERRNERLVTLWEARKLELVQQSHKKARREHRSSPRRERPKPKFLA